jgi:hypothetical protein
LNTYTLEAKELGRGGYSTVYRGQGADGKNYAFKVFFFERYYEDSSKAIEEAKGE